MGNSGRHAGSRSASARRNRRSRRGFTLVESLVSIAVCALLTSIAIPSFLSYAKGAKVTAATVDIMKIATAIGQYTTLNGIPPPGLATIGFDTLLDPWGNPYAYQSFTGLNGKGKMRKDKNLNPINTEYDLYSMGADGQSKLPLTAPVSQDDVILAYDGNYVGLASKF
jgi:general secretion pathway protein G